MKITKNQKRALNFYDSLQPLIGAGVGVKNSFEKGSYSAEESFVNKETYGKLLPIADGQEDRLSELLQKKASAELQIKMWAEGVADEPPTFPMIEVIEMVIKKDYPSWVLKAVSEQASKMFYDRRGFYGSFCSMVPAEVVYEKLKQLGAKPSEGEKV